MKFLIDEDVPLKLLRVLTDAGHDAIRVVPSSSDPTNAQRARNEGRVLVTLDNDFSNKALYPPALLTIVHIRLHPPYAEDVVAAFLGLLKERPPEAFKGLMVLGRRGAVQFLE